MTPESSMTSTLNTTPLLPGVRATGPQRRCPR